MRYCPNDDCPDFVSTGIRQEFTARVSVCPVCEADLVDGEVPEEAAAPMPIAPPSFDSPVPGVLGGSPTGAIQPGESEALCQSCAAPVEPGVRFCESCEPLEAAGGAEAEESAADGILGSLRRWWKGR